MLRWSGSDMVLSGHDLMGRVAEAFMRTANCPGEGPLGFELDGHLALNLGEDQVQFSQNLKQDWIVMFIFDVGGLEAFTT